MFWRYPPIVLVALRVLGWGGVRQWVADYLAYSWAALGAWLGVRPPGRGRAGRASDWAWATAPGLGLRLRARFDEWRAMGWLT